MPVMKPFAALVVGVCAFPVCLWCYALSSSTGASDGREAAHLRLGTGVRGLTHLQNSSRSEKKPAMWVSPLSRFRHLLPSRHWRSARHAASGLTASELRSNMPPTGSAARRRWVDQHLRFSCAEVFPNQRLTKARSTSLCERGGDMRASCRRRPEKRCPCTHCRPSSSEHGPQARTNPHASTKWRA